MPTSLKKDLQKICDWCKREIQNDEWMFEWGKYYHREKCFHEYRELQDKLDYPDD